MNTKPPSNNSKALLQIALAGCRSPLPAPLQAAADAYGPSHSPAQTLLHAATELCQLERCARTPQASRQPLPTAAAPCPLASPNLLQATQLARCLNAHTPLLIKEIAQRLTQHQLHLPHSLLPAWLSLAAQHARQDWSALMAAAGARGAWLAAQNPAWQPLLNPSLPDSTWQEGPLAERTLWLSQQRTLHPAQALASLQAVWASEPSEARAAFLPTLQQGLSASDEAFLDAARSDKRKEVRSNAWSLLSQLPDSAYAQRQRARLREWLAYRPGGLLKKASLVVNLPAAYSKDWAADGLPEKSTRSHQQIGDKANWLLEALNHTPLSTVCTDLGLALNDWPKLISGHEFEAALWEGSIGSLERNPSPALAATAHAALCSGVKTDNPSWEQRLKSATLTVISPDQLLALLPTWLNDHSGKAPYTPLAKLLPLLPPLNAAQSHIVASALRHAIKQFTNAAYFWTELPLLFSQRCHPSLLADWLAFIEPLQDLPNTGKAVANAVALASLRHQLNLALP